MWGSIGRPLGQPVRPHPHDEARTKVLRGAIELDVALSVTHMHAALGRARDPRNHPRDRISRAVSRLSAGGVVPDKRTEQLRRLVGRRNQVVRHHTRVKNDMASCRRTSCRSARMPIRSTIAIAPA
ncbi:hypothetical protein [Mesorhizobium sp. M1295]|uniref:hypothetical protein n=1 Tax=Mesorhizobium sp. M1295 TaxID=2957076 RepID=UPI00333CBF4A